MKFENTFAVQAPVEEVWTTLLDVERVAPCMPGAEVLERVGDNAYKVGIKVKVGPISMVYRGEVEIVERDDETHRATMRARAKEARGQGTATATIHMSLVEQPDATQATIETELQLSGRAAAMGRGVIGDVSQRLVQQFAENLAGMLAPAVAGVGAGDEMPAPAPDGQTPPPSPETPPLPTEASGPATEAPGPPTEAPGPPSPGPPPPPPPRAPAGGALPVGEIAAGVIAGRLSNPRTLAITAVTFAIGFGAIGYVIGKAR